MVSFNALAPKSPPAGRDFRCSS